MADVCWPVSAVTATAAGRPHGSTASAFNSLSVPPMVRVAPDRDLELLTLVQRTGLFGLNELGSDQTERARNFARKGASKFPDIAWEQMHAVQRIPDAPAFLACAVEHFVERGDHEVVLADVLAAEAKPSSPLTYHDPEFGIHEVFEGRLR